MTYIEALQDAIRHAHGCDSHHLESVRVDEQFKGQAVWDGTVEVFEVIAYPKAKLCYAWGHHAGKDEQESRYVTVLHTPPIDSPIAAVRASIVADSQDSSD